MEAIKVWSLIAEAIGQNEFSGVLDERLVTDQVNRAASDIFNEAWPKEDLKATHLPFKRGIAKDERLANIFATHFSVNVQYTQYNLFYGNLHNGAPRKPVVNKSEEQSMTDISNGFAVGMILPDNMLYLDSLNAEVSTIDNIHKYTDYESGAFVDVVGSTLYPLLNTSMITYIDNHELMTMSDYSKIRNNIYANPYKNKIISILAENRYTEYKLKDPLPLKYNISFPSGTSAPSLLLQKPYIDTVDPKVKTLEYGNKLLWLVVGNTYEPYRVNISYIRQPDTFHIDLQNPSYCIDLDFPIVVAHQIVERAIQYILVNQFQPGDKIQLSQNNEARGSVNTTP